MADQIEQAVLAHADETTWKEKGQLLWMWIFVCTHSTLVRARIRTFDTVFGSD